MSSISARVTDADERLLALLLDEVLSGDYINGDHVDMFGDILKANTQFSPASCFLIGALETIQPVTTPHIQILFSGQQIDLHSVGHWVTTYHDGNSLYVYDSLNGSTLTPDQQTFLSRLFPNLSTVPTIVPVQNQGNLIDCGVFAIANATSLALGRDPSKERYVLVQMRQHLAAIMRSKQLLPFPSHIFTPDPDDIDLDILRITPPTSQDFPPLPPPPPRRAGRPLKKIRGRPKTSDFSLEDQRRAAKKRYVKAHPEMYRDASKRYTARNPQVHQKAVEKYTATHPQVNQKAVAKYTATHPQVNQEAVAKYTATHPQVNQEAVAKYTATHPQVNQKAAAKYTATHPQVNQKAVAKYTATHPQVNQEAVAKYTLTNPEINQHAVTRYKIKKRKEISDNLKIVRSVPKKLLTISLIGTLKGEDLEKVEVYKLKNTSLLSTSIYKCVHCGAPLFEEERGRDKWCCGQGAYHTNILPSLDASFYSSEIFLKDARSYNNLFSFSAIGVSGGFQKYTSGISFVKILGRTYHRVFDLSWQGGPNNCAMYIDDGEERMRLAAGRSLNNAIMADITSYLYAVNPFIPQLRRLSQETSEQAHIVFQQTTRRTHGPILGDVPRANEIAAIISSESVTYSPREVVVWKIGHMKPHTVNMFHSSYECLQYPLLFPHGTEGWHIGMQDRNFRKITQVKYYRHLLISVPRFTVMRRLSQEYFVDMFCRTEEERLKFISNNQGSVLRIATREEIDETIAGEGGVQTGRIYLPSSFTNSPRYMQVKYQDGMAIVNRLGKPTYFLTVTCNPKWTEIVASLNSGEHPKDRPDLCNRVFQIKLNFLIKELKSGKVFGKIIYILHVIEFQKRGLPHAHICFKVDGGPTDGSQIDSVIRASIPSNSNSRLRELVLEHLVHGPSCTKRSDLPCVDPRTKVCTKGFPKQETETTYIDDRGFVHYKRSSNNTATLKRGHRQFIVSDLDVVPYNPAILLQMECHANLELASTRKVVKYLFKYIHKGPDTVKVNIISDRKKDLNEVEEYITRRYIGASDAMWRILEFDITGRYPSVTQLPVHLPNKDHVVYRPGQEQEALDKTKSKLVLYLERPHTEELANITYCEFYEKYIIDTKTKTSELFKIDKYSVTTRKRGQVVARMYWVSPSLGEIYFLRMMLLRFPCFSFEGLRTVDGQTYPTFQEAARARGLLIEENEFSEALLDASVFMTGHSLRRFFYILISNGGPAVTLWKKHRDILCEDLLDMFHDQPEQAYIQGLRDLDRVLRNQGSSLRDMGLPQVPDDTTEVGREMCNWSSSSCSSFVNKWLPLLNKEQLDIFNYIKNIYTTGSEQKVVFIDGAGGTGKTLLLNVITSFFRARNQIVLCTATTGVAALMHDGGVTAHSKFKLPLDTSDNLAFWNVSANSQRAELIRKSSLIIWDEAPMAHVTAINVLNRSLQNLMDSSQPFGGKIIIFSGDFRQIPPVVQSGAPRDAIGVSLKKSPIWPIMIKLQLTSLQRSRGDNYFSKFVLAVGDGLIDHVTIGEDRVIPLHNINYVNDMEKLIQFVYPFHVISNPDECCGRAILSGTNANTRDINANILSLIPGDAIVLLSADTCVSESTDDEVLHTELLNTISQPQVPDHRLLLKVGVVCILMRNLCFDEKLVNGTKLIITSISKFCISARRPNSNTIVMIPRITFKFSVGSTGMEMIRRQFPLKVAYAMTINKSQGQTLNVVGVDLRNDVFAHGQLYVALSRVRSSDHITVLVPPERVVDGVPHCANVVYRQLVD